MAAAPVFVTQYEVLRTQDYVLLTLSAPTGEVVGGKMQIQEVQRVALTLPRFLEMAAALAQVASNIQGSRGSHAPAFSTPAEPRPRKPGEPDEAAEDGSPGDWVIRH